MQLLKKPLEKEGLPNKFQGLRIQMKLRKWDFSTHQLIRHLNPDIEILIISKIIFALKLDLPHLLESNTHHIKISKFESKSQLLSERNFGVFKSPKKQTKLLKDFCPSL